MGIVENIPMDSKEKVSNLVMVIGVAEVVALLIYVGVSRHSDKPLNSKTVLRLFMLIGIVTVLGVTIAPVFMAAQ